MFASILPQLDDSRYGHKLFWSIWNVKYRQNKIYLKIVVKVDVDVKSFPPAGEHFERVSQKGPQGLSQKWSKTIVTSKGAPYNFDKSK